MEYTDRGSGSRRRSPIGGLDLIADPQRQAPDASGTLDGIAYDLWLPFGHQPSPAVIVLHGAGSRKENHADFARAARSNGFVALTFDNRGHGASEGELGPRVLADVQRLVRFVSELPEVDGERIALRGSSMGGLLAIQAGAVSDGVAAVAAICPAAERLMLGDLRRVARGDPPPRGSALESMRVDLGGLIAWLEEHDVRDAVKLLGPKPLMLVHARGDEVVPFELSQELYDLAAEPKRLLLLDAGDHRSAQHDAEIQGEMLRWLARAM
jgi:alpha-beta hydrolase superfamily lysophospholipase